MLKLNVMRSWVKWPLIRAHLCTLAVSVGLNSTWRVPREAFRHGGLQFGLLLTVAMLAALPVVLLQLALGQLSQQDAVGVWRGVPFFKGVGYLRLLVSFMGCVYTVVHVALASSYFLHALGTPDPYDECMELQETGYENTFNASDCLSSTFMAPVSERPEYYISMSLIIVFLWIALPFLLYSPIKLMKRLFYVLGPTICAAGVAAAAGAGSSERLAGLHDAAAWVLLRRPAAWLAAAAQALVSTQVAGGYLISAGDSVYASTNVQWTAIAIVASNILASWSWLLFWFAVGAGADSSSAAVLVRMHQAAVEDELHIAWPLLVYATLVLSGVITMLTLLYPIFDRVRRSGGARWRALCAGACAGGAGASLGALAAHRPALAALEDVAVPLVVCSASVLEIFAFVIIYGWRTLREDVEFLTGQELSKYWVVGWFAAPCVVLPWPLWWAAGVVGEGAWSQPPWSASVVAATTALMLLILVGFAAVVVARQVQYDIIGKLKSSFQPSRHWGPRDPITHYYWMAQREADRGAEPRTRYQRRRVGQLAGAPTFLTVPPGALATVTKDDTSDLKRRSNSDDWIYTVFRRKYLQDAARIIDKSKRSVSLDWGKIPRIKRDSMELKILSSAYLTPIESEDSVFKDAISDAKNSASC